MRKYSLVAALLLLVTALPLGAQTPALPGDLPANPEADKCYAICYVPTKFETVTENVQTYNATNHLVVVEPQYETYTERVMVKPASYRLVEVPAEYRTEDARIEVAPAYKEMVVEPAKFETVTERVLVEDESTELRVGGSGGGPTFSTVTNANLYYGSPESGKPGVYSADYGNVLDPTTRKGVDGGTDPFNPNNPNSFVNDPNSPLNASPSLYSNSDLAKLFDPSNANSPFSDAYVRANGSEAAEREASRLLQQMQVGTIAPYIVQEARVKLDRVPRAFRTEQVEVEVTPAYVTYEQVPVECETGDCLTFCAVEVPAETRMIAKRIAEDCPAGYTVAAVEQGGEDYCVRLTYEPAVYGARQIMTGAPSVTERKKEPRYRDVQVQRLVSPARVVEREVPAKYETVPKRVLVRDAYTRYEPVPAEYKTITRRVRKGMAGAEYITPGGVLMAPTTYSSDPNAPVTKAGDPLPTLVNPGAGGRYPGTVLPYTVGQGPDRAGNIEPSGYAPVNNQPGSPLAGMPANYYSAGCPDGFRYDPLDGLCKTTESVASSSTSYVKNVMTSPGKYGQYFEVLCADDAPTTRATIRKVQATLNRLGYDAGTADGIMGARTKTALVKYQKDNGLPIGGLNRPTLKKLGL
ncbi:MAG: peptidoglycan-binding domain-containing protein [Bacteroidota bacterium]